MLDIVKSTGGLRLQSALAGEPPVAPGVFADEADIDAAIAESWNRLDPERLRSITATEWITHEN